MDVDTIMILSSLLWIRNIVGFIIMFVMGLILAGVGWEMPRVHMHNVYVVLAATSALNDIAYAVCLATINK